MSTAIWSRGRQTDRRVASESALLPVVAWHGPNRHVGGREELADLRGALEPSSRSFRIELGEPMGFRALLWRLRAVRALAFEGLGRTDYAATESSRVRTEVTELAGRIADPELRAWFEGQTRSFEISPSNRQ